MWMLWSPVIVFLSLVNRKSEHNRCEPMHHELPPVPPPVPPRRDFMRQTMSPYESSYIAITDLEPHEVAANDQTVSHNQVRVNGRDERSQSFYEELPPHTEASMLSVPPQAERSSSTPVLYSPPDVGVDGLSRSARWSNISQCFVASHLPNPLRPPSSFSSPSIEVTSHQSNVLPPSDNVNLHSSAVVPPLPTIHHHVGSPEGSYSQPALFPT